MKPRVLADFWYADELAIRPDKLETMVASRPLLRRLCRLAVLRAVVLLWLGRRYDAVIPDWYRYGRLFVVLHALSGSRKVLLLEFIDFRDTGRGWRTWIARIVLGPCFRRAVRLVQVMSRFESDLIAARYGLPPACVRFVPWPLIWCRPGAPERPRSEGVVFSAGRGGCDWPTLFAAATGANWKLVVVCARRDLAQVRKLNATVGAEIHADLPRADYDALMARAAVFVACLAERRKSSGHIRVGHAVEAMVPAVVSDIGCMKDYLIDGITGVAVPPGDAGALAAAVNRLLGDGAERARLAGSAFNHLRTYNKADYFRGVDAAVGDVLEAER